MRRLSIQEGIEAGAALAAPSPRPVGPTYPLIFWAHVPVPIGKALLGPHGVLRGANLQWQQQRLQQRRRNALTKSGVEKIRRWVENGARGEAGAQRPALAHTSFSLPRERLFGSRRSVRIEIRRRRSTMEIPQRGQSTEIDSTRWLVNSSAAAAL